jgi:hypothetical protein
VDQVGEVDWGERERQQQKQAEQQLKKRLKRESLVKF